jgi:hypothetical protein
MHRFLYALAALAAVVGLLMLLPNEQRGPQPAGAAASPALIGTPQSLTDSHPQLAVMLKLGPTFLAIQRVQMLNLVNGLWLTDEQTGTLIDHLSELKRLEGRYGELLPRIDKHADEFKRTEALVAEVEAELIAGRQPSPELESEVNRAVTGLFTKFGAFEGLEEDLESFRREAQDAIYDMLTDNQRILVAEYVECIVPPKGDPNNPERIGQASASYKAELEGLRQLSDEQYALRRDHLANEVWQMILTHFPDEQQGATAEKARITAALDDIRAMDGQLAGDSLEKLIVPYELHPVQPVAKGKIVDEGCVRQRIFKFFIENNPVDVLTAWRDSR